MSEQLTELKKFLYTERIALINDIELKKFVIALLKNADEAFWNKSASSTGRYHPEFANGENGLLRHTIALTNELLILNESCTEITQDVFDVAMCACILHDLKKYGIDGKNKYTEAHHSLLMYNMIDNWLENTEIVYNNETERKIVAIQKAVGSHHNLFEGMFFEQLLPKDKLEFYSIYIVCFCDIKVSQKDYIFEMKKYDKESLFQYCKNCSQKMKKLIDRHTNQQYSVCCNDDCEMKSKKVY
jgi:hypothetical protein